MTISIVSDQSRGLTHRQLIEECNEEIMVNEDGLESTRILIDDLEESLKEHKETAEYYQSEIEFWEKQYENLIDEDDQDV